MTIDNFNPLDFSKNISKEDVQKAYGIGSLKFLDYNLNVQVLPCGYLGPRGVYFNIDWNQVPLDIIMRNHDSNKWVTPLREIFEKYINTVNSPPRYIYYRFADWLSNDQMFKLNRLYNKYLLNDIKLKYHYKFLGRHSHDDHLYYCYQII